MSELMIFLMLNYMNIKGVVTEVNTPYRLLKVVKTIIPFDDIYSIELLAKGILFLLFNDITNCRPKEAAPYQELLFL